MISLGSSSSISIGLLVKLRDQFSAPAKDIINAGARMERQLLKTARTNYDLSRTMGIGMMTAGVVMTRALTQVMTTSMQFDKVMKGVEAVSYASAEQIAGVEKTVRQLGKTTVYTAREIASAAEDLAKAGLTPSQISGVLPGVVDLAAATDHHLMGKGGAADRLANIMIMFKKPAEQAQRVSDIITGAVNKSTIDFQDFAESMKYFGGQANILNIQLEEAAALVAVLGNSALKAGIAGRGLNAMLMYLTRAVGEFKTKKQDTVLKTLGLDASDIVDSKGELKNIVDIVDTFQAKFKGFTSVRQANLIGGLMELRAARSFAPLLKEMAKNPDDELGMTVRQMRDYLRDETSGLAKKTADTRLDNLAGDVVYFKSAWESLMITLGRANTSPARLVVQGATALIKWLDRVANHPVMKIIIPIISTAGPLMAIWGLAVTVISQIGLWGLRTTTTFANLFNLLTFGWRRSTNQALKYAAAMQSIQAADGFRYNRAGKLIDASTGRYVKNSQVGLNAKNVGGATGGVGIFSQFTNWLKNLLPNLRAFGANILRFAKIGGIITIVITLVSYLIGWKNVIKGIIFSFQTFADALVALIRTIEAVLTLNWDRVPGIWKDFNDARKARMKAAGFEDPSLGNIDASHPGTLNFGKKYRDMGNQKIIPKQEKLEAQINITPQAVDSAWLILTRPGLKPF